MGKIVPIFTDQHDSQTYKTKLDINELKVSNRKRFRCLGISKHGYAYRIYGFLNNKFENNNKIGNLSPEDLSEWLLVIVSGEGIEPPGMRTFEKSWKTN